MVPLVGFELTTYRLQGGCSTPELKRRIKSELHLYNYFKVAVNMYYAILIKKTEPLRIRLSILGEVVEYLTRQMSTTIAVSLNVNIYTFLN